MKATVIGYEGRRAPNATASWGTAALLVREHIVNAATGVREPYTEPLIEQFVDSGALTQLGGPIEIDLRPTDEPIVVELASAFLKEAGLEELTVRKGLRGTDVQEGYRVFVFADKDAFDAYRNQVSSRIVSKVLDLEDVALRDHLIETGLTLHGHDGALNALSAFYDDAFWEDRDFAVDIAFARVRESHEEHLFQQVLEALEVASKVDTDDSPHDSAASDDYALKYRNGIADKKGLAVRDAAIIFSSVEKVDDFANDEMMRQFPFVRKAPSTHVQSLRPNSATLHFAPTVKGEPFSDRVARYLKLKILQNVLDGRLTESVERHAPEPVKDALRTVVQPTPSTVVEHRVIGAQTFEKVDTEIVEEEIDRPEPKGPEYSDPLVVLGYQSGLLDDWGKLEVNIFPGTRIRLASDRDHLGRTPEGVDVLKQRNDFLFRPALFKLVRQRLAKGKRKYWLQAVHLLSQTKKGGTITAMPSTVVADAFIYRLELSVKEEQGSLQIDGFEPLDARSRELSKAQEWMFAYADICEGVELSNMRHARLGPIYMPNPSPLLRALVVLHEAGQPLHADELGKRVRDVFRRDLHVDLLSSIRRFPKFVTISDGVVQVTPHGERFARAYLAVERRSVTARRSVAPEGA